MIKHNFKRKSNKYNAKQTIVDGIKFPSRKEANYYFGLKLRQKAGDILFFLRQVPFYFPGGIVYRCDFQEFRNDDTVHFIDTKGIKTKDFNLKMRLMKEHYPLVEIEIV